jgi:phage/plasmid-like protein (TIGR03299 family)
MSRETMEWLNTNTLIGFTEKRGNAWHHREGADNHYVGPIPIEEVKRRLFSWEPVSVPLPCACGCGDDRQIITRSDTGHMMGVFKGGYEPHPYTEWLIEKVAVILDDDLQIGSAGLLRGGAQAWVSVEVAENQTVEGVEFRPNLLACTSFDGSLATTHKRIITNVVCDNTMAAGLSESGQEIKSRHTKNSGKGVVAKMRDALSIVFETASVFADEVRSLTQWEVTDKEWFAFLDATYPTEGKEKAALTKMINKRDQLTGMYRNDMRVAPWAGTAWGVLQAVNTYTQHEATFKGGNRIERNMDRMVSTSKTDSIFAHDANVIKTLSKVTDHEMLVSV